MKCDIQAEVHGHRLEGSFLLLAKSRHGFFVLACKRIANLNQLTGYSEQCRFLQWSCCSCAGIEFRSKDVVQLSRHDSFLRILAHACRRRCTSQILGKNVKWVTYTLWIKMPSVWNSVGRSSTRMRTRELRRSDENFRSMAARMKTTKA